MKTKNHLANLNRFIQLKKKSVTDNVDDAPTTDTVKCLYSVWYIMTHAFLQRCKGFGGLGLCRWDFPQVDQCTDNRWQHPEVYVCVCVLPSQSSSLLSISDTLAYKQCSASLQFSAALSLSHSYCLSTFFLFLPLHSVMFVSHHLIAALTHAQPLRGFHNCLTVVKQP